ncbi:MAG: hypothetical protein HYY58_02340, partial [Candidatus Omnitrophica bacterium]|nr:hypothetical protein [Candidatus Omnitrophota bacterium]
NTNLTIVNPKTQTALRELERQVTEEAASKQFQMRPIGHWSAGIGHRYSHNDKTEETIHLELQPSAKWYVTMFQRFTWKDVAGGSKRFRNLRESQYNLVRDLHDWLATFIYRVDREFGEGIFFMLTLKAYPNFPIEFEDSYHQPKIGSQSDPFSPVPRTSS